MFFFLSLRKNVFSISYETVWMFILVYIFLWIVNSEQWTIYLSTMCLESEVSPNSEQTDVNRMNSRPVLTMLEIRYGFASQSQQRIWYPNTSHGNFKYNLSFSLPFPWFTEPFCPNRKLPMLTFNIIMNQNVYVLHFDTLHFTPYTLRLTHSHDICGI